MIRTDSLGEIIDKLCVNTCKQYAAESARHNGTPEERLKASDLISQLNKRRWVLINAINEIVDSAYSPEVKDYDKVRKD